MSARYGYGDWSELPHGSWSASEDQADGVRGEDPARNPTDAKCSTCGQSLSLPFGMTDEPWCHTCGAALPVQQPEPVTFVADDEDDAALERYA